MKHIHLPNTSISPEENLDPPLEKTLLNEQELIQDEVEEINLRNSVPLCVDLDGTLIKTDLLLESLLKLIKKNPFTLFLACLWLLKGKAHLKSQIAKRVEIAVDALPYNEEVIAYIKHNSRKTILITGSNWRFAQQVADYLGIFHDVIASDEKTNLTKADKRDYLVDRFGQNGFDYIGNDKDDWAVWTAARNALVVSKDNKYLKDTKKIFEPTEVFLLSNVTFRDFIKAIRVHQWVKNLLIFIPFFLEHRLGNLANLQILILGFISLSLLASFTYVINDLLDLESDRQNDTKKLRAFASGKISIQQGLTIMGLLLITVVATATLLPIPFLLVLAAYFVSTLSYSLYFKAVAMLDVCVLASLYTLRVIGGGIAINTELSFWLLAFSMFFFLSLALAKRVSELENLKQQHRHSSKGRGYQVIDLPMLTSAGVSSGILSIAVVALYINGEKVLQMYPLPQALWLICPLLLYWIGRVWMITARGEMHEDPILFAIRDHTSILTAFFAVIVILSALALPALL